MCSLLNNEECVNFVSTVHYHILLTPSPPSGVLLSLSVSMFFPGDPCIRNTDCSYQWELLWCLYYLLCDPHLLSLFSEQCRTSIFPFSRLNLSQTHLIVCSVCTQYMLLHVSHLARVVTQLKSTEKCCENVSGNLPSPVLLHWMAELIVNFSQSTGQRL